MLKQTSTYALGKIDAFIVGSERVNYMKILLFWLVRINSQSLSESQKIVKICAYKQKVKSGLHCRTDLKGLVLYH